MTVKDHLHQLIDLLPEREWDTAARVLAALRSAPPPEPASDVEDFHARLTAAGIVFTPAGAGARMPRLLDVPDADVSGGVLEEREEQASRWDAPQ